MGLNVLVRRSMIKIIGMGLITVSHIGQLFNVDPHTQYSTPSTVVLLDIGLTDLKSLYLNDFNI